MVFQWFSYGSRGGWRLTRHVGSFNAPKLHQIPTPNSTKSVTVVIRRGSTGIGALPNLAAKQNTSVDGVPFWWNSQDSNICIYIYIHNIYIYIYIYILVYKKKINVPVTTNHFMQRFEADWELVALVICWHSELENHHAIHGENSLFWLGMTGPFSIS